MAVAQIDTLRKQCHEEVVHCLGTAAVFEYRANVLRRRIRFLAFVGLALPLVVGVAYVSFGETWVTKALTGVAVLLGAIQIVLSLWSLAFRWDDDFAYFAEAHSANRRLAERLRDLARNQSLSATRFQDTFDALDSDNKHRSTLDEKYEVTDNEKRMGMRKALFLLQKECAVCKQIPTTMSASNCDVCGNFILRRF
jgi:mobilome CxxCx(11)CxxC protein